MPSANEIYGAARAKFWATWRMCCSCIPELRHERGKLRCAECDRVLVRREAAC